MTRGGSFTRSVVGDNRTDCFSVHEVTLMIDCQEGLSRRLPLKTWRDSRGLNPRG